MRTEMRKQVVAVVSVLALLIAALIAGSWLTRADADGARPFFGQCTVETTGWVLASPGEDWVLIDQRTVVDKEAYDDPAVEVFDHWQRYSWTGGPHAEDSPPPFPFPDWQPNVQGDPHGIGHAGAYYRSNGNSGNGDWFYLEAVSTTVPGEHHDAVTHEEFVYRLTTCPTETETPTDTPTTGIGTPTQTPDPDRPVRATKCVGNALQVKVTFPNGNISTSIHNGAEQCATKKTSTPHKAGTPDPPTVVVNEEGM